MFNKLWLFVWLIRGIEDASSRLVVAKLEFLLRYAIAKLVYFYKNTEFSSILPIFLLILPKMNGKKYDLC